MTSLGQEETIPPQPPATDMAYRNFVGTCRSPATREIYKRALQYFLSYLRLATIVITFLLVALCIVIRSLSGTRLVERGV
jgi:hypothetical protein